MNEHKKCTDKHTVYIKVNSYKMNIQYTYAFLHIMCIHNACGVQKMHICNISSFFDIRPTLCASISSAMKSV